MWFVDAFAATIRVWINKKVESQLGGQPRAEADKAGANAVNRDDISSALSTSSPLFIPPPPVVLTNQRQQWLPIFPICVGCSWRREQRQRRVHTHAMRCVHHTFTKIAVGHD